MELDAANKDLNEEDVKAKIQRKIIEKANNAKSEAENQLKHA